MAGKPPEADEDTWVVPPQWWAAAAPFHGSARPTDHADDAEIGDSLDQLVHRCSRTVEILLATDAEAGPTALTDALAELAYLARTPRAGALICVLASTRAGFDATDARAIADAWVAEHGVAFAAEAAVRLAKLQRDLYELRPRRYVTSDGSWKVVSVVHQADAREQRQSGAPRQIPPGEQPVAAWSGGPLQQVLLRDHPIEVWSAAVERVRERLAGASESDYRLAVARLARIRAHAPWPDVAWVSVFLAPTEQQWLDEELSSGIPTDELSSTAETGRYAMLAASATTGAQLARIVELAGFTPVVQRYPDVIVNCGPAAATVLAALLDEKLSVRRPQPPTTNSTAITPAHLCSTLAHFPTDEAFGILLARITSATGAPYQQVIDALARAAVRYPRRALRMLVDHGLSTAIPEVHHLLREHIRRYPALAQILHRDRPHDMQELDLREQLTEAMPSELSGLLTDPPWKRRANRPRTRVLVHTPQVRPPTVRWLPGERELWAQVPPTRFAHPWKSDPEWAAQILAGNEWNWNTVVALASGPETLVRARLHEIEREKKWSYPYDFHPYRRMIGRFEHDALELALAAARGHPVAMAPAMTVMDGTAVTRLMVPLLLDSESRRLLAAEWFDRHIDTAAIDLVAWALGRPGSLRRRAEYVLHQLVRRGHIDAIHTAAGQYGETVLREVEAGLQPSRRIWQLPERIPAVPHWLEPTQLPQIRLRDRDAALPRSATVPVCTMLAMRPHEPYDGVRTLIEVTDPRSLAAFARAVFRAWYASRLDRRIHSEPRLGDRWILGIQGLLGDDATAHLLGETIPRLDGYSRNRAIDALVQLRSAAARDQLDAIAHADIPRGAQRRAKRLSGLLSRELDLPPAADRPG